jgi:MSHA biogenesis protein MshQ
MSRKFYLNTKTNPGILPTLGFFFLFFVISVMPTSAWAMGWFPDEKSCGTSENPTIGNATINEVYSLGNTHFVEIRIFDSEIDPDNLSLQICYPGNPKDSNECIQFDDFYRPVAHPYYVIDVGNNVLQLQKNDQMDIILYQEENRFLRPDIYYIYDYLSVNGYDHQDPRDENCDFGDLDTDITTTSNIKGIERSPDGTGDWKQLDRPGNNGEPTYGNHNEGMGIPEIDHFRIEHPAEVLTCQSANITIRACIDENCTEEFADPTTVTFSIYAEDTGDLVSSNMYTFTGNIDLPLRHTTAETLYLRLENPSIGAENNLYCNNEERINQQCWIEFVDTAIFIDGDSSDAENDSDIVTQIAGKPSNENPDAKTFQVKVLRTDENTGACVPALIADGTAKFSYLVPEIAHGLTDNTFSVNSNGDSTSLFAANTPKDLDLIFDNNGVASFDLTSTDTGKYQLQVSMDILVTDENGNPLTDIDGNPTNETYTVSDTSNTFIVRPLAVFVDATGNPNALDSEGFKFTTAGNDFTLNFKALSWNGNANSEGEWSAAPASNLNDPDNYARVPEWNIVQPEINVIIPADNGDLTFNEDVTFAAGSNSVSVDANFNDVGIIQFDNVALDFMGEEVLLNSPYIGRFYPHHFELTQGDLTNRVESGCSHSDFTYLGENLEFTYTLTAKNAFDTSDTSQDDTTTTKNYVGNFAKFHGDIDVDEDWGENEIYKIWAKYTKPNGDQDWLTEDDRIIVEDMNISDPWTNGEATFNVLLNIKRNTPPDGPFKNVRFGVLLQDDDERKIDPIDEIISGEDVDWVQAAPTSTELRYGLLQVANAHGSELLPIKDIEVSAEYYDETHNIFRLNNIDSCTSYDAGEIDWNDARYFDGLSQNISATGTGNLVKGRNTFSIHQAGDPETGPGTTGYVLYESPTESYLQYDWNGDDNYDDNPTARATFGIYKGNERIIYLRETTWR